MKSGYTIFLKLRTLVAVVLMVMVAQLYAADDDARAWLEGTVKDTRGKPLDGWKVSLYYDNGKEATSVDSDANTGGFYSFRNIYPHTYEIRVVPKNVYATDHDKLLRQRIFGVNVENDERTILNLVLSSGTSGDFEEVTEPSIDVK